MEIAEDVFFIERGWLNANHFVARRPSVALIDTGYKDDVGVTVGALRGMGIAVDEVRLIVNTHCHCDHVGGNRFIQEASGCRVLLYEAEKRRMDAHDDVGTWWRFHDTWAEPFRVDEGLSDGEVFQFGPLSLEVLAAPGHSKGQMALYCPQKRFLISADALWNGDLGVINPIVEGDDALERALSTLERFLSLDVAVVYPGHGPPIVEPRAAILRCIRRLQSYQGEPRKIHHDHLRKMAAYVILTKGRVESETFFDYLSRQIWFNSVVDRYFDGRRKELYEQTIAETLSLGMIRLDGGCFVGAGKR